jgi:thymidylate synthase
MPIFEADSADQAWLLAVEALKKRSDASRQTGRGGSTAELLHVTIQVRDARQRWVLSRSPGLSVAFAIVEVIGILSGRQDSEYLNFFNPKLPQFAGSGPHYDGAYGFRLRANFGFDQLSQAANALKSNPDGRQVVLQIWDATRDFPSNSGAPASEDIPCNLCSMLKIREGKLEWSQIMRSNDVFKGLPYNFVQFMSLQEVLAGWIGVEPGTYTHFSDSLHVYEQDLELAFSSSRVHMAESTESLALPNDRADPIWREMNRRVNLLVKNEVAADQYVRIARLPGLIGARLTGGGFGGCTINLVEQSQAAAFAKALASRYADRIGIEPQIHIGHASVGAHRML